MDPGRPWLTPLQPALGLAWAAWQAGSTVADALNATRPGGDAAPHLAAGPLRFVPPSAQPAGEAYEAFIHRSADVPTRDNAHDFYNGLVWLAQPALKRRLNALHAAEIARAGVGAQRGPLRDALTLFDENGALLAAPAELLAARCRPATGARCSSPTARCGHRHGCSCSATRCWRSWPPRRARP